MQINFQIHKDMSDKELACLYAKMELALDQISFAEIILQKFEEHKIEGVKIDVEYVWHLEEFSYLFRPDDACINISVMPVSP